MKKITLLVILFITPVLSLADASGIYNCSNKINNVVSVGSQKFRSTAYQTVRMTLSPDGSAVSIDLAFPDHPGRGSWSQSGNKIFFTPNYDDVAKNALYGCSLSGSSCTFLGATYTYNQTINRAQTIIKGNNKINLTMLVNGQLRTNNATVISSCKK